MAKSRPVIRIVFTVIALVVFLTCLVFSFLSAAPVSFDGSGNTTTTLAGGIFTRNAEDSSLKYPTDISPADWVFTVIWPVLFLWNLIGMLYMVASLFLSKDKSPILREEHPPMPFTSLIFWSITWGSIIGWLFANDKEFDGVGLALLMGAACSSYLCIGFSYWNCSDDFVQTDKKMQWLVRILIHNGLGVALTWLTCAWKISLVIVIAYEDGRGIDEFPARLRGSFTVEDAGTVALSLLLVELVVWFILENFWTKLKKPCLYTLTIYPTLIFVFAGIFVGNKDQLINVAPMWRRNQIISLAALVLTCLMFVARCGLVWIERRRSQSSHV